MGWDYSDKTKQIFMDAVHGKPGTHLGDIEDADGVGEHGSIACGDALRFTFKVDKHHDDPTKDIITQACYLTFGCTSAIAASEALCAIIESKHCNPIEALKVTNRDIVDFLGGLPEQKIHCSVMGAEALEVAVFDWAKKRGVNLEDYGIKQTDHDIDEGTIVCQCFSATAPYIKRKVKELGLKTIAEVTNAIKAGGACMSCHNKPGGIQDIINEVWGKQNTANDSGNVKKSANENDRDGATLSPYQMGKRVEQVIEEMVRPMLAKDGGNIEIIDIKKNLVYCRLMGACSNCAGASTTLKLLVEKTLKDKVDSSIKVISV